MKIIQRTGVLLLLLVFLYGTTGLSVLNHSCNSSNEKRLTVYPELFRNAGSTCCEDEETGYVSAGQGCKSGGSIPENVDAAPCCKSIISFYKLEITTDRIEKTNGSSHLNLLKVYPVLVNTELPRELPSVPHPYFQFYSPPLFGKLLVHYLHQIKIPAHPSLA